MPELQVRCEGVLQGEGEGGEGEEGEGGGAGSEFDRRAEMISSEHMNIFE